MILLEVWVGCGKLVRNLHVVAEPVVGIALVTVFTAMFATEHERSNDNITIFHVRRIRGQG